MDTNKTLVLVKPEATGFLDFVRQCLPQVGTVLLEKAVTITEEIIRTMYPNNTEFEEEVCRAYFLGKTCAVFILEGPDIIEDVVRFVGEDVNPEKCHPRSLRYNFWNNGYFPFPVLMRNNKEYYFNGVHRTKSAEEFKSQASVILNGEYEKLMHV
jgi:nucleoside diphosphate kinase